MKFIAYYRVSTLKQGASGLGLEAQRSTVEAHIKELGGSVWREYVEVCSGTRNDRVRLTEAMRECRLTGATLVIAKLDRLSRDRRFLMELADSKLKFICSDMREANPLTIGMMAVMADYETKLISARTKAALSAAKNRGVVLGNPKLALVRNTDTTKAREVHIALSKERNNEILLIINDLMYNSPKSSLRKIAELLNEAGYKTARGSQFSSVQVMRILRGNEAKTVA